MRSFIFLRDRVSKWEGGWELTKCKGDVSFAQLVPVSWSHPSFRGRLTNMDPLSPTKLEPDGRALSNPESQTDTADAGLALNKLLVIRKKPWINERVDEGTPFTFCDFG